MHRLADPAAHEVVASQHAYLAVLATAPSTAVGLAQDMLKRAVGLLDADAMIDAGAAVLTRAEKKLVKAQLGLFAALRTDAGQRNRLSRIVGEALEGMLLTRAAGAQAGGLVGRDAAGRHGWRDGRAGRGAAQAVTIPPPRREPLPDLPRLTRSPSSMTRNCMP